MRVDELRKWHEDRGLMSDWNLMVKAGLGLRLAQTNLALATILGQQTADLDQEVRERQSRFDLARQAVAERVQNAEGFLPNIDLEEVCNL